MKKAITIIGATLIAVSVYANDDLLYDHVLNNQVALGDTVLQTDTTYSESELYNIAFKAGKYNLPSVGTFVGAKKCNVIVSLKDLNMVVRSYAYEDYYWPDLLSEKHCDHNGLTASYDFDEEKWTKWCADETIANVSMWRYGLCNRMTPAFYHPVKHKEYKEYLKTKGN